MGALCKAAILSAIKADRELPGAVLHVLHPVIRQDTTQGTRHDTYIYFLPLPLLPPLPPDLPPPLLDPPLLDPPLLDPPLLDPPLPPLPAPPF